MVYVHGSSLPVDQSSVARNSICTQFFFSDRPTEISKNTRARFHHIIPFYVL